MSSALTRLFLLAGLGAVGLLAGLVFAASSVVHGRVVVLTWVGLVVPPIFAAALWLAWRRPDHVQARRLLLVGSAVTVAYAMQWIARAVYDKAGPGSWLAPYSLVFQWVVVIALVAMSVLVASYPDGIVERRWQRIALRGLWWQLGLPPLLLLSTQDVVLVPYMLEPPQPSVSNPFALGWLAWLGPSLQAMTLNHYGVMLAMLILLVRYLQAAAGERARMLIMACAGLSGLALLAIGAALRAEGLPPESPWMLAVSLLAAPVVLMIPVSIVVGVLSHRLYDVSVVIRRSALYGALSLGTALAYVGLAAAPGLALRDRVPVQLAVVMTIAAALVFQPLRRWLDSLLDRLVFGERVNRYRLLSSFGATLENTIDLNELLPLLATTVRTGLNATWVRVSLHGEAPDAWLEAPVGVAGLPRGEPAIVEDLRRANILLGRIECGRKPDGYQTADRELLAMLARQSATAIANVRLTVQLEERLADLSRSRARIITAQDAERRRIERNIHDGVQQEVVALITKLRLARNRFARGELTDSEFGELQRDARELLIDLRELAQGIHPPVLSDNGLVAAVEARADRLPLDVTVIADDSLRRLRLGSDIEGTAYFVICEALTNVIKHADATHTLIELNASDRELSMVVCDNGRGLVARNGTGSGLTNLRDRVEAVGGRLSIVGGDGVRVHAILPLVSHA